MNDKRTLDVLKRNGYVRSHATNVPTGATVYVCPYDDPIALFDDDGSPEATLIGVRLITNTRYIVVGSFAELTNYLGESQS